HVGADDPRRRRRRRRGRGWRWGQRWATGARRRASTSSHFEVSLLISVRPIPLEEVRDPGVRRLLWESPKSSQRVGQRRLPKYPRLGTPPWGLQHRPKGGRPTGTAIALPRRNCPDRA